MIGVADTTDRGDSARARFQNAAAAPHVIDPEIGEAVRGLVLRGSLEADAAARSSAAAHGLVADRYPHPPLAARALELLNNVSFYAALCVALGELLGLPLLTANARLFTATGPRCERVLV